jgi:hypothetical protein
MTTIPISPINTERIEFNLSGLAIVKDKVTKQYAFQA